MSPNLPNLACRFCERTRKTCLRIPGGCCGVCDHEVTP